MIEANVEIYEARAGDLAEAAQKEVVVLHKFRATRSNLGATSEPMTGAQKIAALALLDDAKAAREAAATLVDQAYDATSPI